MAKRFLTLNVGAANVELAEYEAGAKGSVTLVNYGKAALSAPLDEGSAEAILPPALHEIVRATGMKPGPVALSLSGQLVFPRFAAIPAAGGEEKFDQMVRLEIEQNVPFPIDEMICDRQVLGDTETGEKSVMIVAAKVDQVEELTQAVAAAGFSCDLVDVAPIALTNAVRQARPDEAEGCVVILDIGAKTTSLVIAEGDKIYNRSIPVAGHAVTKEIAQALGCTREEAEEVKLEKGYVSLGGVTEDEDEVADRVSKVCRAVMARLNAEISRSVNFYRSQQHGQSPAKLYLTGGSALLPQLDQFFAETLQIEVEYFNPFERIGVGAKVDATALESDAAVLAATAGLALHRAGLARFAIDLLPPSIVSDRTERARIPYVVAGGLGLVASLVLLTLGVGVRTSVVEARRDAVRARVERLQSFDKKVAAAEKKVAAVEAEAARLRTRLDGRSQAVRRLAAVRASLLPGMWLSSWEGGRLAVRYWKDAVRGESGKTPGELVVDKLKGRGEIDSSSVRIADMTSLGKEGDVAQFTVELKFK